jgi:hypothetical protein
MEKIQSNPNGKLNTTFLDAFQKVQKQHNMSADQLIKVCEKTVQNMYNHVIDGEVTEVKIDPKNADFTVIVRDNGKLSTYINPSTGQVVPGPKAGPKGEPMPFADWTPVKKDKVTGEPVDKDGLNEKEYYAAKEIGDYWDTFWDFWF